MTGLSSVQLTLSVIAFLAFFPLGSWDIILLEFHNNFKISTNIQRRSDQ